MEGVTSSRLTLETRCPPSIPHQNETWLADELTPVPGIHHVYECVAVGGRKSWSNNEARATPSLLLQRTPALFKYAGRAQ